MLNIRVIPSLLIRGKSLVKTIKFNNPKYIGDPINAVRIFNEREVDEIVVLDILSSVNGSGPNFGFLKDIVSEAFMPVGYGGGIRNIKDMDQLFQIGIEKIIINSSSFESSNLIKTASEIFGSQSIVVCMDVKRKFLGGYILCSHGGTILHNVNPIDHARKMEEAGSGEIIINSIDCDGTMNGYDIPLIKSISSNVNIPVVASGGAGKLDDLKMAIVEGGASAVAAGSIFIYHGKNKAVLINYPEHKQLIELFQDRNIFPHQP